MASLSFTDRFKNKLETIGKDGVIRVDASKAISKEQVPEHKTHKFYVKLTHSHSQVNNLMGPEVFINKRNTPDIKSLSLATIKKVQNLKKYISSPLKQASARLLKEDEIESETMLRMTMERKANRDFTGKIAHKLLPPLHKNSIYLKTTLEMASMINNKKCREKID